VLIGFGNGTLLAIRVSVIYWRSWK
jgi:hypothetical protein